jgi:predicted nucleotidyltransferase
MQNLEEREELFRKIASFLEKYGATKVAIFGSYVRAEERPESDIDILVEFAGQKSLLTLVNIELELSDYLGIKVDLLTEKSISPYLIDGIKKDSRVISK